MIRAQGTPAAITALPSRFRQGATSALGCTTAADERGGHAGVAHSRNGRGCPGSSLTPSSAPGVGQTGPSLVLPWGRAPSAENIRSGRPVLPREAAVLTLTMAQDTENYDPIGAILIQVGIGPLLSPAQLRCFGASPAAPIHAYPPFCRAAPRLPAESFQIMPQP